MLLETSRLTLRDYTKDDIDNFYRLKSNQLVWNYSTHDAINKLETAKEVLEELIRNRRSGKVVTMALFLTSTGEYIGECGFVDYKERLHRGILECHLLPQYWNRGYATEIIKIILKYAFDVKKMMKIEIRTLEANKAAFKVLNKCGFMCEGTMRSFHKGNQYLNICYYALDSVNYKRIKSQSNRLDTDKIMNKLTKQVQTIFNTNDFKSNGKTNLDT